MVIEASNLTGLPPGKTDDIICEYCKREFCAKSALAKHLKDCEVKRLADHPASNGIKAPETLGSSSIATHELYYEEPEPEKPTPAKIATPIEGNERGDVGRDVAATVGAEARVRVPPATTVSTPSENEATTPARKIPRGKKECPVCHELVATRWFQQHLDDGCKAGKVKHAAPNAAASTPVQSSAIGDPISAANRNATDGKAATLSVKHPEWNGYDDRLPFPPSAGSVGIEESGIVKRAINETLHAAIATLRELVADPSIAGCAAKRNGDGTVHVELDFSEG